MARTKTNHTWTPEESDLVRSMGADGLSFSEIARALGPWANKNMVIGHAHRHNLVEKRPSEIGKTGPSKRRAKRQAGHERVIAKEAAKAAIAVVREQQPSLLTAPVIQQHRLCTWITADRRPWTFCEKPCCQLLGTGGAMVWSSWCQKHHHRVYRPTQQLSEAA